MKYKDFLKEKELLLDSIENNTSEHWKNYYKDVPIECIYDDLVIDINEIKRLQQENQELKDKYEKTKFTIIENCDLRIEIEQLKEKVEYLKSKIENKDSWCQLIADIGYDYDGFNKVDSLKSLIDELVRYALYSRDNYDYLEWLKEDNKEKVDENN